MAQNAGLSVEEIEAAAIDGPVTANDPELVAHVGTTAFRLLSQQTTPTSDGWYSRMVVTPVLQVVDIYKFHAFHAIKWAAIGFVIAIIILT